MLPNPVGCQFGAPANPLLLTEAIERALCGSPKTREAWADVKLQAAGVGVARSPGTARWFGKTRLPT
jgi:outer membrane protein